MDPASCTIYNLHCKVMQMRLRQAVWSTTSHLCPLLCSASLLVPTSFLLSPVWKSEILLVLSETLVERSILFTCFMSQRCDSFVFILSLVWPVNYNQTQLHAGGTSPCPLISSKGFLLTQKLTAPSRGRITGIVILTLSVGPVPYFYSKQSS